MRFNPEARGGGLDLLSGPHGGAPMRGVLLDVPVAGIDIDRTTLSRSVAMVLVRPHVPRQPMEPNTTGGPPG